MEKLVNVADLAKLLGVNKGQIYRLIQQGELPAYRVGKHLRLDAGEALQALRRPAGEADDGRSD